MLLHAAYASDWSLVCVPAALRLLQSDLFMFPCFEA